MKINNTLATLAIAATCSGTFAQNYAPQTMRPIMPMRISSGSPDRAVAFDLRTRVATAEPSIQSHSSRVRYTTLGKSLMPHARIGSPRLPWNAAHEFQEMFGALDVFGADNRVQKTATSTYPWSTHCDISIAWPDGTFSGGSATMIDENCAITAGHCVFDGDKGGWASSITVYPGRNGSTFPFTTQFATNLLSWSGWTGSDNWDDDMGVIKMTGTPGNSTGTLGLAAYSDNQGKTGNLSGYPGDKGGSTQWYDSDPIDNQTTNRLYYRIDTNDGQSGSGVYRIISGDRYVVGAHSGVSSLISGSWNRATRVTSGKFDDIIDFID